MSFSSNQNLLLLVIVSSQAPYCFGIKALEGQLCPNKVREQDCVFPVTLNK